MARMLGRFRAGGCGCQVPGPDCAGHDRDTRWRKRVEQRQLDREFAAAAGFYDSDEGREWLERGLAEAEGWPLWDLSDCIHGCNGSPSCGSERCTFICHA